MTYFLYIGNKFILLEKMYTKINYIAITDVKNQFPKLCSKI